MKATSFRLIDAAKKLIMPERCEAEAQHIHEKRCVAVKHLGTNWLLHRDYVFNPRHSNNPDLYHGARQPYLDGIARRGAADREKNEAFQRAQLVRAALDGKLSDREIMRRRI